MYVSRKPSTDHRRSLCTCHTFSPVYKAPLVTSALTSLAPTSCTHIYRIQQVYVEVVLLLDAFGHLPEVNYERISFVGRSKKTASGSIRANIWTGKQFISMYRRKVGNRVLPIVRQHRPHQIWSYPTRSAYAIRPTSCIKCFRRWPNDSTAK